MADCNDLFTRRQELLAQRREVERQLRENQRSIDLDTPPDTAAKPVIFRTRKAGEKVVMTTEEVDRQLQYALKQAQGSEVAAQVERGFEINEKPQGSLGRMFNYTSVVPDRENFAKLMEAFSITRKNLRPELHKNLTRKFTAEDAANFILNTKQEFVKDKDKLLQEIVRQVRGLEFLPEMVTRVRVIKEDAVSAFLDAGDAMVRQALENPGLDVDVNLTNDAWAAGKWALIFNELDSFAARKVAQAQVSRQFAALSPERFFDEFDPDKIATQRREQINPRTLMGQIMQHIDSGDVHGLQRMLAQARALQKTGDLDLNADWFNRHMFDIETLRKDGMLSGLQTLGTRNPVSGMGMLFTGTVRQGIDASLRLGDWKGMAIAFSSLRETMGNLDVGWRIARDSWTNGRSVMDLDLARNAAEAKYGGDEAEAIIDRLLNQPYRGNPAERAAVAYGRAYAAWRLLLSDVVGKGMIPKLPALRFMSATDEMVKWAAYTNSVRIGAEVDALDALGKDASEEAVRAYVDDAIRQATFTGVVTPEEIRTYRRNYGIQGNELSDSEVAQKIANELVGAPTLNTPLSVDALEEARRVTGTQDYANNAGGRFLGAVDRFRRESWQASQLLPFFRNPVQMALFTVDTALPVRPMTTLTTDAGRMIYERLTKGSTDVQFNRKAMAQVILSGSMFSAWVAGHSAGLIRGGGPQEPNARREWLRFNRPYSIGPEGQKAAQVSLGGLDPFDVLFVWSDLADLAAEGKLSAYDQQTVVTGIGEALARIIRRKAGFATVSRFLEWINDPVRNKITDVLALAAGSYVPQIGNMRDIARVVEPDNYSLRAQPMTAEERYQLGDDRLNQLVQSLKEFTYQANPLIAVAAGAPRDRDWLGTKMARPFGFPVDALVPWMPVLMPDSPVHPWLRDNGIIAKPRMNGILDGITMTPEIEERYRTRMSTLTAPEALSLSARLVLAGESGAVSFSAKKTVMVKGPGGQKIPVTESVTETVDIRPILDRIVRGRTMHDALLALKNDPWYQSIEADPEASTRPDLRDLPRAQRRRGVTAKLVSTIVAYYDELAQDQMRNSDDPVEQEWAARALALKDQQFNQQLQGIQELLPKLGAGFAGP
jgi:hypothetical protein